MILTGHKIASEVKAKNISITPFQSTHINPNSYDYRLGDELKECVAFRNGNSIFRRVKIPKGGYTLKPHRVYLGATYEKIGSRRYTTSLIGKSSLGRLGLFLTHSANLGHRGNFHKWTLELCAARRLIVYPRMIIGQVSFWKNKGKALLYQGVHGQFNEPREAVFL